MAKLTKTKYRVKIEWAGDLEKVFHLVSRFQPFPKPDYKIQYGDDKANSLSETFTITRKFDNALDRFNSCFHKGSHTKEYEVTLLNYSILSEEYIVEAKYSGVAKPFYGVFNNHINGLARVDSEVLETETEAVKPVKQRQTKTDHRIIKAFMIKAMKEAGYTEIKKMPSTDQLEKFKATIRCPTGLFYTNSKESMVVAYLGPYKIALAGKDNGDDFSQVRVLVNYEKKKKLLHYKGQQSFKSLKIYENEHEIHDYWDFLKENYASSYNYTNYIDLHKSSVYYDLYDVEFYEKFVKFLREFRTRPQPTPENNNF